MRTPLIYVVGASGSGKDSLMRYAREKLAAEQGICFAHRYITRAADAGGENHVALSPEEFATRRKARLFALSWRSHELSYGIGIEINQWLAKGVAVVVNGSRGYLAEARQNYPEIVPVYIEVPEALLRERLLARGRESVEQIEQRLSRNKALQPQRQQDRVIINDGSLETAGDALVELIRRLSGARACA
ncbi:MAG: phosphonate metabolism protein/1,5-bisphosphokinase (PRPP-forming) PhnN [Gammaproteobacteria bacterium HGW-Gammaproteobacteria-12]|jgi:ribose 1,5-bisphosphokinase|nr:MAG: phosphonate metabolism protein/1,5-bisphosphokinase (PRPP-forming) PhnN [Gammaproteobacteria bacterium HGW-Gammaproteobacteria-12]